MRGEVVAVLEIELRLPALLGGTRGHVPFGRGIAQDGGAELLVDEDAGPLLPNTGRDGAREAVIDHALGGRDLRRLVGGQRPFPAEHLGLERLAMVEGKDVEVAIVSEGHRTTSRSRR
mgnify:CR=1 FL=1